ncbi:hypothetical protein BKA62DRAFT_713873 [Auriculariales sp. MPI-PUGE-AT-0066]|nr:hypothetical protein BKA62DRAFT_713873 [Auriculariales sp. MPI-PUGE-AT-0066]
MLLGVAQNDTFGTTTYGQLLDADLRTASHAHEIFTMGLGSATQSSPFYSALIPPATMLLATGMWKGMQWTQSRVAQRRRSDASADISPVAQLPPEILLVIFDLLRRRSRCGAQPVGERRGTRARSRGYCDVLAVQLVCRTWKGPATQVLYDQVVLHDATDLDRFGCSIARRPQLLQHVQGLHFNHDMLTDEPSDNQRQYLELLSRHISSDAGPRDLTLAWNTVRTVSVEDEHARSWEERRNAWEDSRFFGFEQCSSHVSSLQLVAGDEFREVDVVLPPHAGIYGRRFKHLKDLWLSRADLPADGIPVGTQPLPSLETLRVTECKISSRWLAALLAEVPSLRSLDISSSTVCEGGDMPLRDVLQQQCRSLTQLTIRDLRGASAIGSMSALESLRSWTLSYDILEQQSGTGLVAPPALEKLVVFMDNPPHGVSSKKSRRHPSHKLLNEIGTISSLVRSWKRTCPALRRVELRDQVGKETWPIWEVASYLLYSQLETLGIFLDVHLRFARRVR